MEGLLLLAMLALPFVVALFIPSWGLLALWTFAALGLIASAFVFLQGTGDGESILLLLLLAPGALLGAYVRAIALIVAALRRRRLIHE